MIRNISGRSLHSTTVQTRAFLASGVRAIFGCLRAWPISLIHDRWRVDWRCVLIMDYYVRNTSILSSIIEEVLYYKISM